MDDQKRQKVMLGVLAVVALGAGGYFYMSRSSDAGTVKDPNAGFTGRQARKTTEADSTRPTRKKRAARADRKATTGRKERTARPTSGDNNRRSRRGKAARTKKKKMVPAA